MAAILDTKSLHVARMLSGLREDLKRNLFTEISSASAPVCAAEFIPSTAGAVLEADGELQRSLVEVNHHYQTDRWVPDARFVLGRPLLKKVVRRLMSFYTARQTAFNTAVVRIANSLNAKLGYYSELITHHHKEIRELRAAVEKLSAQVTLDLEYKLTNLEVLQRKLLTQTKLDIESRLERLGRPARSLSNGHDRSHAYRGESAQYPPATAVPWDSYTLSHLSESYFAFIDKFRGDAEEIKKGLRRYLPYFNRASNVVDVGCGRGEFLELCKENHIGTTGIDINEDMILYCRRRGVTAEQANALEYMTHLKDKSLDGVFMSYVTEHMGAYELINVLSVAYRKLQFGSNLVIEAINPTSLFTLANVFYLDLLHVRLINPQALMLLLEACGFRNLKLEYLLPVPPELRLYKMETGPEGTAADSAQAALYNKNIDKLNDMLFGYQAYAIIGRK